MVTRVNSYVVLPSGCERDDNMAQHHGLLVEYRGAGRWAVTDGFEVWNRSANEWVSRRVPDEGRDDYLATCRYPESEALAIAASLVDDYRVNGRTYAQWQAHFATVDAAFAENARNMVGVEIDDH